MSLSGIIQDHFKLLSVILAFYIATFSLGVFISLSIPFNTSTYPKHIAEIQFNEEMFTGSVNGISVQNLIALRLGIWAGNIEAENTHMDMPARFGYEVDITEDKSTRTIVGGSRLPVTGFLISHVFICVATLFTCCHACLPRFFNMYWIIEGVVFLTSVIGLLVNWWLVASVSTEMQKLGESIVTKPGPISFLIGLLDLLAIVVALLSRHLVKEMAKPAKPKDDGGGPKTYRLAHNPAALQQAQGIPPSGTPQTPFQRVQALMPPRTTPAAVQQTHTRNRRVRRRAPATGRYPLPEGWEQLVTDDNQIYYANDNLHVTSWLRPPTIPVWPDYFEFPNDNDQRDGFNRTMVVWSFMPSSDIKTARTWISHLISEMN